MPRDGSGKVIKTQESIERDTEAANLRAQGWTFQKISDHLGYGSRGNVQRALHELRMSVVVPAVDELRDAEDAKLDKLEAASLQVLAAFHLKFHDGEAITHKGEPVKDVEPVLKAVDRLLRIAERRAKLWGIDSPVKVDHGGAVSVKYIVEGIDMGQV